MIIAFYLFFVHPRIFDSRFFPDLMGHAIGFSVVDNVNNGTIVAPVRQILILQTAVRACGAVRAGVRLVRQ